jgi:hypothetical protein
MDLKAWQGEPRLGEYNGIQSHSQVISHFGSSSCARFWIFERRFGKPNHVEIELLLNHQKGLEKWIFKLESHFPFQDLKHKLSPNEYLGVNAQCLNFQPLKHIIEGLP